MHYFPLHFPSLDRTRHLQSISLPAKLPFCAGLAGSEAEDRRASSHWLVGGWRYRCSTFAL